MDDNSSLYENLLRATNNISDITFTRYATVTKVLANQTCNVKEVNNELTHNDVPILNGLSLSAGDTIVLGFAQNSLYNPYIIGVLNGVGSSGDCSTCIHSFADAIVEVYQE